MRQHLTRLIQLVIVCAALTGGQAYALQTLSTNNYWFTTGDGKGVYLTGPGGSNEADQCLNSINLIQRLSDSGTANAPCDVTAALATWRSRGVNFMRLWTLEQEAWGENADFTGNTYYRLAVGNLPYLQVGTRTAVVNGVNVTVGIYNLTIFNSLYFSRMRETVLAALASATSPIYPSVMLFSGGHLAYNTNTGFSHPMHSANNVNGINGDPNSDGKVLETHTLDDPAITAIQDAYICKVVDTLKDIPNAIIQVSNEEPFDSSAWQNHVFDRVRTCEAQLGSVRHLLWQGSYYFGSPGFSDNSAMYANPRLDIVGPACLGGENFQTDPRKIGTKPALWDSDHANATCNGTLTPSMIGQFFTRGVHLSSLGERESASVVTQLIQRQAQVVSYSRRMGLATMEPDSNGQQTYPATAILDDFERADEDPVTSSWGTLDGSGCKVVGGALRPNAYGASHGCTWNVSRAADQEFYFRLGNNWPSDEFGVICAIARLQTAATYSSDHYEVCATPRNGNDVLLVAKLTGAAWSVIGAEIAIGRNFSSSDTIGIAVRGTTISAVLNGTVVGTRDDSSVSGAGYGGVIFDSVTSGELADVGGGALPAVSTGVCSTGFCLRTLGHEYLLFRPSGSTNPTIDLTAYPSASFTVEYLNPDTGAITTQANVLGGAVRTFTIGWSGEAFVYLKETPFGLGIVQASSVCYGGPSSAATCTLASPPQAGNTLIYMVSQQQYPFTQPCSQSKVWTTPNNSLYEPNLAVEAPVTGSSSAGIWFRAVTQTGAGTFAVSLSCPSGALPTYLVMSIIEVSGIIPSYSAVESPGWAGQILSSPFTVTSFQPTSQADALAVAVMSLNAQNVTIGTASGWTERHNNGDQTGPYGGGAAATKLLDTAQTPAHTWTLACVAACSTGDHTAAVIAVFKAVTSSGGGGGVPVTINRTLRWTDNAANETSYRVEKRTDQSFPTWVSVASGLNPNTTTYTAQILATETGDCWRVFAGNANGERVSNEACGPLPNVPPMPPPAPPPPVIQIGGLQTLMDDELL